MEKIIIIILFLIGIIGSFILALHGIKKRNAVDLDLVKSGNSDNINSGFHINEILLLLFSAVASLLLFLFLKYKRFDTDWGLMSPEISSGDLNLANTITFAAFLLGSLFISGAATFFPKLFDLIVNKMPFYRYFLFLKADSTFSTNKFIRFLGAIWFLITCATTIDLIMYLIQ
jgi:hypothetical protein